MQAAITIPYRFVHILHRDQFSAPFVYQMTRCTQIPETLTQMKLQAKLTAASDTVRMTAL